MDTMGRVYLQIILCKHAVIVMKLLLVNCWKKNALYERIEQNRKKRTD